MHSDREKLVERLHHAITTASNDDMSRPGTNMRERHTARLAAIEDAIAALSEPVKDEPVAWWRVGEWGDGSTKPGEAVIFCDAHEAAVAAGVPSHLAKMIVEAHNDTVTRPAGERPAVAVEAPHSDNERLVKAALRSADDISTRLVKGKRPTISDAEDLRNHVRKLAAALTAALASQTPPVNQSEGADR